MATDHDLNPVYDTSPCNTTPSSSVQNACNILRAPIGSNAVQGCSPSRTRFSASNGEEELLCHSASAREQEEDASGLDQDYCQSPKTSQLDDQHVHSVVPLDTKCPVPTTKLKINSPFSLNAMYEMFNKFGSEKRALLESIGLGGLLKVHRQRLQCRNLLLFLLSSMDPNTGTISLRSGDLTLKDRDVNLVLGIPYGGEDVNLSSSCPAVIDKLKSILLLDSDSDISIEAVNSILDRDYGRKMNSAERDAFKVAAMIFVDSCFLGPRGCKRKINKDILKHVAEPSKISKTNWSGYVLRVLQQSASKVQQNLRVGNKSVLLEGCLLFLLVLYLDNLNFGYMTPRHDVLPRIAKYTPCLVSQLVSYDRVSSGAHKTLEYGRNKLRTSDEVVYSRHDSTVRNRSRSRGNYRNDQIRNGSSINIHTSFIVSEEHMEHSKVNGHFNMIEAQEALDEHVQVFRKQIQQSIDELQRKVQILVNNLYQVVCSSSVSGKDGNDGRNNDEHQSETILKLGPKAQTRKYYMAVHSSSISTGINQTSSENCNMETETLENDSSPVVLRKGSSASHNLAGSCVLADEGEHDVTADPGHFRDHSIFPPSSFPFSLDHKDVPLKTILEIIRVLPKLSNEDKNLDWYIHNVPRKLVIGGQSLYLAFYNESDFSHDIMNAVIRLYQELDDEMYQGCCENRWRHYLSAEWAEHALMEDEESKAEDFFVGQHFPYKGANFWMVVAPVHNGSHWSLYSWDFRTDTISILDPVTNSMDILCQKHDFVINRLHEVLLSCKKQFIKCCDTDNKNWHRNYLTEKHPSSHLGKSGLYTAFYARFFDGRTCTRSMVMEDSVTLFQTTLLCQLLGSMTNKGSYPEAIRVAMTKAV